MNTQLETPPETTHEGLIIEHVLLSITIVSNREGAGQFDDSCAYQVQKAMNEYHGIQNVEAQVLYKHTKIEHHVKDCSCHHCQPPRHDSLTQL